MDIVYFVKDTPKNEELKYSLRSVEKNFPHRNVWFIGGCPKGLFPDKQLKVRQNHSTKWENTNDLLRAACMCDEISNNFILFNDDFFVLKPVREVPYYYEGSIRHRIGQLKGYQHSEYREKMEGCRNMLLVRGYDEKNFAVHMPMIINKEKMLACMKRFPVGLMWRSLYGNFIGVEGTPTKDQKIVTRTQPAPALFPYVSTNDGSFRDGVVGRQIRMLFPHPSSFEQPQQSS